MNDKTIFKYLEPNNNTKLSLFNNDDLKELLFYLNKYYLEYRNILSLDQNITFGIELEFDNFIGSVFDHWPFQLKVDEIVGNNRWITKNDITLKWGREIASDVLIDNKKTWIDLKNICNLVKKSGSIENTCSTHIHIGSQILGDNPIYWYRLFKLWEVYENIIYRFGYGEYLTHRDNIIYHAKPVAKFFDENLDIVKDRINSCNLLKFMNLLIPKGIPQDLIKKNGISFWHMLADDEYNLYEDYNKFNEHCTIEYRNCNGTNNEIIIQNQILFYIKLMLYSKSDAYDEDIINQRKINVQEIYSNIWEYSNIYLEQAIELADMIYDNNLDKLYFLRQYLKSFEVEKKPFIKAKQFTMEHKVE